MNHKTLLLVILIICTSFCGCTSINQDTVSENDTSIVVTDSLGNVLSFPSPPQRIAVSGADIATLLLMLDAQDQVIAVSEAINKDPQISSYYSIKESLGDASTMNPERIMSLKPDLLLIYASSQPSTIENIKKTGVTIGFFDCYKQDRLIEDILTLGKITGKEQRAKDLSDYVNTIHELVLSRTKDISYEDKPSVYFELGDYTAAANQSGGDFHITTAGGRNIAENTTIQWVKVTPEWIISRNPDVIIKTGREDIDISLQTIYNQVIHRPGFNDMNAIKMNRTYIIHNDMLYGPQSCIGLLHVAKILYPNLFLDINLKEYTDDFCGRFYAEGNTTPVIFPIP